jgi:flagellin
MDENKEKFREDDFIMRINNNIMALNTHRQLGLNNASASKSLEKLSSGFRINRAGDDAAGLAISEKMRAQIRGLNMASKNAQDSISMIQTAEGALQETQAILQRMRELAVQSSNDTNTDVDRGELQKEINQLNSEIDRIANTTQFNTKVLMKGSFGTTASSDASANIAIKSAKAESITEGTYALKVTTAATQATVSGSQDISGGVTITADTNDTLVLNGVTIKFNAGGLTSTDILNRINQFTSETNVVASLSGNNLLLTDERFGLRAITVAGNAVSAIIGTATNTAGKDAAITIGGVAANVKADANDGRILTVTTGALKGIVLDARGTTNSTANITINRSYLTMQIGANENQLFRMSIEDMGSASLGVSGVDITSASKATSAITTIDKAIEDVSAERSKLGAYQNRLEHTIKNLDTSAENLQASESRIRDVDMAKEMMSFTKQNILMQAATAMLAQANQAPQGVLQLLR